MVNLVRQLKGDDPVLLAMTRVWFLGPAGIFLGITGRTSETSFRPSIFFTFPLVFCG